MNAMTRRDFLQTAAIASAGLLTARGWSQVAGANDDIRVAVMGLGGRGAGSAVKAFSKMSGVRLVAVCDVDSAHLDKVVKSLSTNGIEVKGYTDCRQLLESNEIDAVSIATPNHWHSLAGIWAMEAGKDVYVEKPVSHNLFEGRQLVNAARKYKKICQTGTQCRSSLQSLGAALDYVNSGQLGKIQIARGFCYKRRPSIGKVDGPQTPPSTVDYDQWIGPADMVPLMRKRLHYDWHWVWNTGNGDLGNQGIHQMDICRWFLGEPKLAPRVISVGGRMSYVDDGETANTQLVWLDYAKAPLLFEVRGLPVAKGEKPLPKYRGVGIGVIIDCEGGYIKIPSYTSASAHDKDGKELKAWKGAEDHYANFIKAVRSRKVSDLNADIEKGHISSGLCHLGNTSLRLGKLADPDHIRHTLKELEGMPDAFERMATHLDANEVDITREKLTLGVPLRFNPDKERYSGNRKANKMLTRPYRDGYRVEKINV